MKKFFSVCLLFLSLTVFCDTLRIRKPEGNVLLDLAPGKRATLTVHSGQLRHSVPLEEGIKDACVLKIRSEVWSFYAQGSKRFSFPAPFCMQKDSLLEFDSPRISSLRFQPVVAEKIFSDFMVEEGAPNPLYPWDVVRGDWRIHTVGEEIVEELQEMKRRPKRKRLERAPPDPSQSPNFYCLKGEGKDCLITLGYDFFDDYAISASMQLNLGVAGVVFYMQSPDDFYSFEMHASEDPENGLLILKRQRKGRELILARIRTPLYPHQWRTLEVHASNETIRCFMDGVFLTDVRESLPVGGAVGLLVDTPHEVKFDDVSVESLEEYSPRTLGELKRQAAQVSEGFLRKGRFFRRMKSDEDEVFSAHAGSIEQIVEFGRKWSRYKVAEASVACIKGRAGIFIGEYRLEYGVDSRLTLLKSGLIIAEELARESEERMLILDFSDSGLVKCIAFGKLFFVQPVDQVPTGSVGFYVSPNSEARFSQVRFSDERNDRFPETFQPSKAFAEDPFMKHWASPEGEWLFESETLRVCKGDIFSAFSISVPFTPGSKLHLGIDDDLSGGFVLETMDAGLRVFKGNEPSEEIILEKKEPFTVSVEDDFLIIRQELPIHIMRLPEVLSGKKIAAENFRHDDFADIRIVRTNVINDFFVESPHDWFTNGGTWKIINRFQCKPSWSHMVGENADGLASFWRKEEFSGDYTLEFYAGIRHGWYANGGNLSCTIAAEGFSPGSGYTANFSEWDRHLSQRSNALYKNSEKVDSNTVYTVPRFRDEGKRKYINPLINGGRDIHGAWYYIKVRKIGNRVETWFDNELINVCEDPSVIAGGKVGIWTYRNSITVASVRICADKILPPAFPFQLLAATESFPSVPLERDIESGVTIGGEPLDPLHSRFWTLDPAVGFCRLDDAYNQITVTNSVGAGTMFLQCELPQRTLSEIAGWRFLLKTSGTVPLKAYYKIYPLFGDCRDFCVSLDGEICRSDTCMSAGKAVTGTLMEGFSEFLVMIPNNIRALFGKGATVRFEGFGNLESSLRQAGLASTPAGAFYTVSDFSVVPFETPVIQAGEQTRFQLNDKQFDRLDALMEVLSNKSSTGMNKAKLTVRLPGLLPVNRTIAFLEPESEFPEPKWDSPYTLVVCDATSLPQPKERSESIFVNGKRVFPYMQNDRLNIALPYGCRSDTDLVVTVGNREYKLSMLDRPNDTPRLGEIAGMVKLHTFTPKKKSQMKQRDVHFGDYALKLKNHEIGDRLKKRLGRNWNTGKYPLFTFSVSGEEANISIITGDSPPIAFAEDVENALNIRGNLHVPITDSETIRWGCGSDAFIGRSMFSIGSVSPKDRSGAKAQLILDDLCFGPFTGPEKPLRFRPFYDDPDGISEIQIVQIESQTGRLDLERLWKTSEPERFPPGKWIVPQTPKTDGIHFLLMRAADTLGNRSPITLVPQYYCSGTPKLNVRQVTRRGREYLSVKASLEHSAPLDAGAMRFTLNGRSIWKKDAATVEHKTDYDEIRINYPLLLAEMQSSISDGDRFPFILAPVQDFSGNIAAPVKGEIIIDFESDSVSPRWNMIESKDFPFLLAPVEGDMKSFFKIPRRAQATVSGNELVVSSEQKMIKLMKKTKWDVQQFPLLSLDLSLENGSRALPEKAAAAIILKTKERNLVIPLLHAVKEWNLPGDPVFLMEKNLINGYDSGLMTVDVEKLLQQRKTAIQSVQLLIKFPQKGGRIRIRHFSIHRENHKVSFNWSAYDGSGMKYFRVVEKDRSGMVLKEHILENTNRFRAVSNPETACLYLTAEDNAGNLSLPFVLPLKQNVAMTGE